VGTEKDEREKSKGRKRERKVGPDRLIYAGGWGEGSTAETYRASVERVRSFVSDLSASDQAKVLGGTAAKLFGFVVE
jgi:predicted TIM-barrel fold metal-dependent hydrolase